MADPRVVDDRLPVPPPSQAYLDIEEVVFALLKPLGGITVFSVAATSPWPHLSESVSLQIDVRASSKKRARDRAYSARTMILTLPATTYSESLGAVARVEIDSGPFWFPEPEGAPRYVLRVTITTRVARLVK